MGKRKRFRCVVLAGVLCLLVRISGSLGQGPGPSRSPADVLIVNDSLAASSSSGLIVGYNVVDLLGHFGLRGKLVSLEEYRAGDVSRHRFTIVLGVDDRTVEYPQVLLNDVKNSPRPLMWVNRHIFDVLRDTQFSSRIGLRLRSTTLLTGYDRVNA